MELLLARSRKQLKPILVLDLLSSLGVLIFFLIYEILICLLPRVCNVELLGHPNYRLYTNCYRYLQYYYSIIVCLFICCVFEETFRKSTRDYLYSLGIKVPVLIVIRLLIWFLVLWVLSLPSIVVVFWKINDTLLELGAEKVPLIFPITHCSIALLFFVLVAVVLMIALREKELTMVAIVSYCALEAGPFHIILEEYTLSCGSFNLQNYDTLLPPNIMLMCILSGGLMLCIAIYVVFHTGGKRSTKL